MLSQHKLACAVVAALFFTQTPASAFSNMPSYTLSEYDQELVHNIDIAIERAAENYLCSKTQFSRYSLPWQFSAEFKQHLEETISHVKAHNGTLIVTKGDVNKAVRKKFESFCQTLNEIIMRNDLTSVINKKVRNYLSNRGLSEYSVPSSYMSEYRHRIDMIKSRSLSIMSTDNKQYIREHELDKILEDELYSLVRQIKDYTSSSSYSPSISSYSTPSTSYSTSSYASPSSSYEESQKIYSSNLDMKVTDLIHKRLATNNLFPDSLPSQVVSNYHDKTATIFKTLRTRISDYGRSYVTIAEAELVVRQELESVITAAKECMIDLVGQSCSICLENYAHGERVGILNCGHIYHKDCIYTWFKTKKTCPVCYKENAIVSKQKTVS